MIGAHRAAAVLLAVGLSVTACTSSGSSSSSAPRTSAATVDSSSEGPYQPTDEDRTEIRELLRARAAAVEDGDEDAFLATVDPSDDELVDQQRTLFGNLARLPVASLDYAVDDAAGLPPADLDGDDPTFRPGVIERVRLSGVDQAPVGNLLEDTFVQRDGRWLLGAETLAGDYPDGEEPQSRPWGGGVALAVARRGDLLVLVDRDERAAADRLAEVVEGYIRADARALGIAARYDLLVDATTSGSVQMMNTLDESQAAAVTFPVFALDGGGDAVRLGGLRVKINPDELEAYSANEFVLRHELVHFLTFRRLGAWPTWLAEGLADYVATLPRPFAAGPAGVGSAYFEDLRKALPTKAKWGLDPPADYLIARAAVTYLAETYGMAEVLALGRAYEDRTSGDDPDQVTRRLLPRTLGISEPELVSQTWELLATLP